MNQNILNIQTKKEIYDWFNFLNKNLITNNNSFFHYPENMLQQYIKHPDKDLSERFEQFYSNWSNFNNQKRILQRFFSNNKQIIYPKIFKQHNRQIIHKFSIDFNLILTEINTLKLNNKKIPYSYIILIKKLTKTILLEKLFPDSKITYLNIDILKNIIELDIDQNEHTKEYSFKLTKFLQKWQLKFPELYKTYNAYLIISSNYKDILLQSTFKQWTSCLNLINTYAEGKIKYSCVNNIKNGNLVAYCILDLNDGKSIDEIMDDLSYHGLCYNRCFWRCSIKRLININNKDDYLFITECTSYGTIMQNAITYNINLFYYINKFLNKINQQTVKTFQTQTYKIYKINYPMFSDMFTYTNKHKQYKIYLFNNQLIHIESKEKTKLKKYINYNINILTYDIIELLNIFKFFNENKIQLSKEEYINQIYFNKQSYILNNTYNFMKKYLK